MNNSIVSVEHVSKKYKLYNRNADRLLEAFFPNKKRHSLFYALDDINFSLNAGDSLGIIGENGSGKSTLLKIISGVLAPSSGRVKIVGSLGCLLELGGGFNAELSGIENIRLQMLMNGEKDVTLEKSIIAFADIGNFINIPVKKYSSGMFMRLAFACATAINPSILIVDEALAVGDSFFVKKCIQRIYELLENNTTLLFVSHDIESIRRLCTRSLWIDKGKQMLFGVTKEVAESYIDFLRRKEFIEEDHNILKYKSYSQVDLSNPLVHIQWHIDLTEQHLFIKGAWGWGQYGDIRFRVSESASATAAFRLKGEKLNLSFMRGGGFTLPAVFVDGKRVNLKKDNDNCFPILSTAPAQICSFSLLLEDREHEIFIDAENGKIGWVGGERSLPEPVLKFEKNFSQMEQWPKISHSSGDRKARICKVELLDAITLEPVSRALPNQLLRLRVYAERLGALGEEVSISFKIENKLSVSLFGTSTQEEQYILHPAAKNWVVEFVFNLPLKTGLYTVAVAVVGKISNNYVVHEQIDAAIQVAVNAEEWRSIWGEFYNPVQIYVKQNSYD